MWGCKFSFVNTWLRSVTSVVGHLQCPLHAPHTPLALLKNYFTPHLAGWDPRGPMGLQRSHLDFQWPLKMGWDWARLGRGWGRAGQVSQRPRKNGCSNGTVLVSAISQKSRIPKRPSSAYKILCASVRVCVVFWSLSQDLYISTIYHICIVQKVVNMFVLYIISLYI